MLTTPAAAALVVSLVAPGAHERANPIKPPVAHQHQAPAPAAGASLPEAPPAPRDHPSLRLGPLVVDFKTTVQEDVRDSYEGAEASGLERFTLERGRVGINGALFGRVEFEIERELTAERRTAAEIAAGAAPRTPWKDAFVDVELSRAAQVRGGRFKIPFGLDALTPIAQSDFVYRTLAADYLAPSRDVGLMVHGRLFGRGLRYAVGAFVHDGDNARSRHTPGGDRTYAVRVTGRPFRSVSERVFGDLTIGGAFAATDVGTDPLARPNGLRFETTMTDDTFFSPVYVNGSRRRWEGDVDWALGPISARAEFTEVRDERRGQALGNANLPEARYRSWYIAGTWLITGERKERPLRPAAELFNGGIGAFEIAARYERLWADSIAGLDPPLRNPRAETIYPNSNRVATAGVKWYIHQAVALQFNLIRQRVDDGMRSPVGGSAPFWSRVLRLQLAL